MELPIFKAKIVQTGNSRSVVIPAKIREDFKIEDDSEYWVTMRLEKEVDTDGL